MEVSNGSGGKHIRVSNHHKNSVREFVVGVEYGRGIIFLRCF